jgi:hypothetical protein
VLLEQLGAAKQTGSIKWRSDTHWFILGIFLCLIGPCPLHALAIIIFVFAWKFIADFERLCEKLRQQEEDFRDLQDDDFCDW